MLLLATIIVEVLFRTYNIILVGCKKKAQILLVFNTGQNYSEFDTLRRNLRRGAIRTTGMALKA